MLKKIKWLLILLVVMVGMVLLLWRIGALPLENSKVEEHQPGPPSFPLLAPDNSSPSGAVLGLAQALQSWDLGLAAQWMAVAPQGPFTDAYHNVLAPTLARMELETGSERIEGDTAWVDVSVTAVDVGGALGNLSADAASYLVESMLHPSVVDWNEFLAQYLSTANVEEMLRVRRDATVTLTRDSGEKWRIDSSNPENRVFFNALTGGLLDVLEQLEQMVA